MTNDAHQAEQQLYQRAKSIAHEALDLPPGERESFVARSSAGDDLLAREARLLIDSALVDSEFMSRDPLQIMGPEEDDVVQVQSPRHYRIIRRLGEGGHGLVLLAERSDGEFKQDVALKLLNITGQLDPARSRHFRDEARILARLNHPNIAHLIDTGALPNGRPFIAMEYVDGVPIAEFSRQRSLSVRERIKLFLKVCDAVDYAHQRLVVHRDIKPPNILVTEEGDVRLLDFGIAQLLEDEGFDEARDKGPGLMTAAYASPEQHHGGQVTTLSDIYSLGVVLYELLSGVRPFGSNNATAELRRQVSETEPPPPSQQSPDAWPQHRELRSTDLDAIVLKAMRKEPSERYQSIHAFKDDLRRALEMRPVLARPQSWSYVTGRYIRRNRWAVSAGVSFAVLISAFGINRQFQLERTQLERDKAQQIATFMSDLFANADPSRSRGASITVREMLDRGAQALARREGLDPELKASMQLAIGRAYAGLGLPKLAMPSLDSAIDLYAASSATEQAAEARMLKASALSDDGDYAAAIAAYQSFAGPNSNLSSSSSHDIIAAKIHELRNRALLADGAPRTRAAELQSVISNLEKRPKPSLELLEAGYSALAIARRAYGDSRAAAEANKRAIALAVRRGGANEPKTLGLRHQLAAATVAFAPAEAARMLRSLVSEHARLVGKETITQALWMNDLAVALEASGQNGEAIKVLEEARAIARRTAGPDARYYLHLSGTLASQLATNRRTAEAADILKEILPALERNRGSGIDNLTYVHSLSTYGRLQERVDDPAAERTFLKAAEVLKGGGAQAYPSVREEVFYRLAAIQVRLKNYDAAKLNYSRLREVEPANSKTTFRSRVIDIDLALADGRNDEAAQKAREEFLAERKGRPKCTIIATRLYQQYAIASERLGASAGPPLTACPAP